MSEVVYADARLPLDVLPEQFRRNVDPASPPPLRLAAAQALVPMPPGALVTALFMLSSDPDERVAATARNSLDDLPAEVVRPALAERLDVRVLDHMAERFRRVPDYLDAIIMNGGTADETVHSITKHARERQLELIANNQVRLLRYPKIIEALYLNRNTRMSTVDRVIDFAVRAGVYLEGIPAFKEAVEALGLEMPKQGAAPEVPVGLEAVVDEAPFEPEEAATEDELFSSYLEDSLASEESGLSDLEAEFGGEAKAAAPATRSAAGVGLDGYESAPEEVEKEGKKKRLGRSAEIMRMNVSQKVRLALLGTKTDRGILIRDRNRVVSTSVIKSPKVNAMEAATYAGLRNVNDDIIRYISAKRAWLKNYRVKLALTRNPKCPTATALRLLPTMRKSDLKTISTDKNVAPVVSMTAKQIIRKGQ